MVSHGAMSTYRELGGRRAVPPFALRGLAGNECRAAEAASGEAVGPQLPFPIDALTACGRADLDNSRDYQ
jgi:hypothetical protein